MTFNQIRDGVRSLRLPRESSAAAPDWHTHNDILDFLASSVSGDVPLYISDEGLFLYAFLVPLRALGGDSELDMLDWNFMVPSGYYYDDLFSNDVATPDLSAPIGNTGSRALDSGTPIFFSRNFVGLEDAKHVEMNQPLAHMMELYWVPQQEAWCRLSRLGEIVRIAQIGRVDEPDTGICCTVRQDELDLLMYRMDSCIIRVFDSTRSPSRTYAYQSEPEIELVSDERSRVRARLRVYGGRERGGTSVLRGFQIIRCSQPRSYMASLAAGRVPRRYESFLIHDWKHERVVEWSSDPKQLGNYFVSSDLPYTTSPAYFKPEVLTQYRQDPARFVIGDRVVRCRGAWQVRYDVNDEGLVSAYIGDLSSVPHEEQLRWKAFNVKPQGGLSERTVRTDFKGEWDDSYDPLRSLKDILHRFPTCDRNGRECILWAMPSLPRTRDIDFLGYVFTESRKEWEEQILALAQILVEGLNSKTINSLAVHWGCRDKHLGSIRQLERVLIAAGLEPRSREAIIEPLAELQRLRTREVAHSGAKTPSLDLRGDHRDLLERCDAAMRTLAAAIEAGDLVPS